MRETFEGEKLKFRAANSFLRQNLETLLYEINYTTNSTKKGPDVFVFHFYLLFFVCHFESGFSS